MSEELNDTSIFLDENGHISTRTNLLYEQDISISSTDSQYLLSPIEFDSLATDCSHTIQLVDQGERQISANSELDQEPHMENHPYADFTQRALSLTTNHGAMTLHTPAPEYQMTSQLSTNPDIVEHSLSSRPLLRHIDTSTSEAALRSKGATLLQDEIKLNDHHSHQSLMGTTSTPPRTDQQLAHHVPLPTPHYYPAPGKDLTNHEKRHLYMKSLEVYAIYMHRRLEKIGITPPRLYKITYRNNISEQTLRTMLAFLRKEEISRRKNTDSDK
ncbi:hypothetical protein CVT26_011537 [Gymnopilus dilepis]|uniref:Uncharacterized protein n=1 Tax=Gymnopilus dilepis TaxID=231916 RepID=A0A409WSK9_9AGAR|nr:hypothetical protein CVT26_011537 [Gymnopilus dilepis]